MGLDREYNRGRIEEERRLVEWLDTYNQKQRVRMMKKWRREDRRFKRRMRRRVLEQWWSAWDPRQWDPVAVIVWVCALVGVGWFWYLVFKAFRN